VGLQQRKVAKKKKNPRAKKPFQSLLGVAVEESKVVEIREGKGQGWEDR